MLSNKKTRLYNRMQHGIQKKAGVNQSLEDKRAALEQPSLVINLSSVHHVSLICTISSLNLLHVYIFPILPKSIECALIITSNYIV